MMMITLPWPPTGNLYWRFIMTKGKNPQPVIVRSRDARKYLEKVSDIFQAAGIRPVLGLVDVTFLLFRPAQRGDLDNHLKVVLDAMQGFAYYDDNQVRHIDATLLDDKFDPRVEVTVKTWEYIPKGAML